MTLLGGTAFGEIGHPDSIAAWRTMVPAGDAAVVVRDGADVVGQCFFLDCR